MSIETEPKQKHLVLGNVSIGGEQRTRTPLHIDFDSSSEIISPQILDHKQENDPSLFNAVGSMVRQISGVGRWHLPVIDADGGAHVLDGARASKVVIGAQYEGRYTPSSKMRDVLDSHGFDLEVFQSQKLSEAFGYPILSEPFVNSIVLRSAKGLVFRKFDSATEGHSHLYINAQFTDEGHSVFIKELGNLGIVSKDWVGFTEQEGMAIVRTPWAKKDIAHMPS